MALNTNHPKFKHDCDSCFYLGSNETVDFYYCKKNSMSERGSLIIRLGDNPSDYFSMPLDVVIDGINSGVLDEESVFVKCYRHFIVYSDVISDS